nr:serine/threonine-protein kinase ATR [Tanacetum cinerariifolium]
HLPDVLLFYAKGLHKGHKNLFQALPRLLTLWFELGSIYKREGLSSNPDMIAALKKANGIMQGCLNDLPTYHWLTALDLWFELGSIYKREGLSSNPDMIAALKKGCLNDLPTYHWLTVLPQLVSRICHQNSATVRLVKLIITTVLRNYTQQALWIMAAVSKSTVKSRREAAAEIINSARKGSNQGAPNFLFGQFASLIDHLIRLCFHASNSRAAAINISTEFSALKRMMPLEIIMPTQGSMNVNISSYDTSAKGFFSPTDLPTITGIADEAEVLSS